MNFKKILSAFLAVMMLLSVFTVTASAEDELPFTDVAVGGWAYEGIKFAYENGLMNGTGGTSFSPTTSLTRAMVVTVLYRLAGSPYAVYDRSAFVDVANGLYYSKAACWALLNKVVTGTDYDEWGTPYFSPDRAITRQELATLFVRFANFQHVILSENGDISGFNDASKVASWASDAMKWATEVGLVNGTGDGKTLSPEGLATREQFATIVYRYCSAEFEYNLVYETPKQFGSYKKPTYELCEDADFYVAVDGNDNNPGTKEKPLATIEGARDAVRKMKDSAKGEIVVAFMAGEYPAPNKTVLEDIDGGSEDAPITYRAYGDGDVIFNDGVTIKANEFVPIDEDEYDMFPKGAGEYIKKVDMSGRLPEKLTVYNYLFSEKNGMCWQARNLNKNANGTDNYVWNMTTEGDRQTCIKLEKSLISAIESFTTIDGLWVKGKLRCGYQYDVFEVTGYDPETNLLYLETENWVCLNGEDFPYHGGFMYEGRSSDALFFYNLAEFLDAEGEYWIDMETETLYVYLPEGDYTYTLERTEASDAISTWQNVISKERSGSFLTIEEGADYINFVGLTFSGGTKTMIVVNSDNVTFDGCAFSNFTGNFGLRTNGSHGFVMENCEMYNFPDSGLYVESDADQNNIISAGNVIRNNFVHDYGNPEYWSVGITVYYDVGVIIEHNEFQDAGHGGVEIEYCIDSIIQYNVFDNLMMTTQDFGCVYSYSNMGHRDNHVRYNLFKNMPRHDSAYGVYNDCSYGVYVYGNLFFDGATCNIVSNGGRDNVYSDNISIVIANYAGGGLLSCNHKFTSLPKPGEWTHLIEPLERYDMRVKEGEEGYELWLERWPEMYSYNFSEDVVKGDPTYFFNTINRIERNRFIEDTSKIKEVQEITSFRPDCVADDIISDNYEMPATMNLYFKCPAKGDYTIVSNADDFENIYDFSLIGIQN